MVTLFILLMKFFKFLHAVDQSLYTFFRQSIVARDVYKRQTVTCACDEQGNVDMGDLRAKAEENKEALAALMITYPSTHGIFETEIKEICEIIHACGAQVYMDGANMNAQVGLTNPCLLYTSRCV